MDQDTRPTTIITVMLSHTPNSCFCNVSIASDAAPLLASLLTPIDLVFGVGL